MLSIALHAYTSQEQKDLRMVQRVTECGGWVFEENAGDETAYRLRFEVRLSSITEVYGSLQQAGLLFTPVSHRLFTEMCLCQKHLPKSTPAKIVSIDLRIGTLDEQHGAFRRFVRIDPV